MRLRAKTSLSLGNACLDECVEFANGRLQIIHRRTGGLHDKISHLGNGQRPAAGASWAVDDEYIIVSGNFEGLGRGGKGFYGNGRLQACMQAGAMSVNGRALLRVQVSNLDFQTAVRGLARQSPRECGFPDAAFL